MRHRRCIAHATDCKTRELFHFSATIWSQVTCYSLTITSPRRGKHQNLTYVSFQVQFTIQHRHKPNQSGFAILGDIQVGVLIWLWAVQIICCWPRQCRHWGFLAVVDGDELFVVVRSWFGKWRVYALPVQVVSAEKARFFTDPLIQNIDVVQADRIYGILKLTLVPAWQCWTVSSKSGWYIHIWRGSSLCTFLGASDYT